MPNVTPDLALPYPLDSDARAAGANAIQDLAEAVETQLLGVEADLASHSERIDAANAVSFCLGGTAAVQTINNGGSRAALNLAASYVGPEWQLAGGRITYVGAGRRAVQVNAHALVVGDPGYAADFMVEAEVLVSGALAAHAAHTTKVEGGGTPGVFVQHTFALPTVVGMNPGDYLELVVENNSTFGSVDAGWRSLSAVSLGSY